MNASHCQIHNVGMKEFTKEGRTWYSHQTDDLKYPKGWCNGKPSPVAKTQSDPDELRAKTLGMIHALSQDTNKKVDWIFNHLQKKMSSYVITPTPTREELKDLPF